MSELPTSVRRIEGDDADRLAVLVAAYDDLQVVLACCERMVNILAADPGSDGGGEIDTLGLEALWTLALLSYARCFTGAHPALSEEDLGGPADEDAITRHRVLMHLRDRHSDPEVNPRESFTVGVAQGEDGSAVAVAVTSVTAPALDDAAVRQAGGVAFALVEILDARIETAQQGVLDSARRSSRDDLDKLELIEVAAR